jgi:hypothetical protein
MTHMGHIVDEHGAEIVALARAPTPDPTPPPSRRRLIPIVRSEANAAGGTGSDVFNAKIIRETLSACSTTMDNPDLPEVVAETIARFEGHRPD